jgi:hypothetical protein
MPICSSQFKDNSLAGLAKAKRDNIPRRDVIVVALAIAADLQSGEPHNRLRFRRPSVALRRTPRATGPRAPKSAKFLAA